MNPQEYKELIKKDTIKIGQDIDALIKQGYTVKRLRPRRPRKGELVMSMTKGIRTNTNRRGQAYSAHALRPETNVISAPKSSYYKTSG